MSNSVRVSGGMGADDYLFGVEIYRDVAEDEPAFALSGAGRLSCTAFEHCFDTGHHLLDGEGFGNVVVTPYGEARQHVVLRILGCQEDDGYPIAVVTELLGHFVARHAAHHDVEQYERMFGRQLPKGFLGGGRRIYPVSFVGEIEAQYFAYVLFVVYDEYPFVHVYDVF